MRKALALVLTLLFASLAYVPADAARSHGGTSHADRPKRNWHYRRTGA